MLGHNRQRWRAGGPARRALGRLCETPRALSADPRQAAQLHPVICECVCLMAFLR